MLKDFFLNEFTSDNYLEFRKNVCDGVPVAAFDLPSQNKCELIISLDEPSLFIVRDEIFGREMAQELHAMSGEKIVFLPSKNDVVLYKQGFNKEKLYERIKALGEIENGAKYVVTTFDALLQLFPKKLEKIVLNKDQEYDLYDIISSLVKMGYKREEYVERVGTFSVRGDVLEIFPINLDDVYRVDFFGDQVENIRILGEQNEIKSLEILMATDVLISEKEVSKIRFQLRSMVDAMYRSKGQKNALALYNKLYDKLQSDLLDDSLQYVFPLIENKTNNILDFMSKNTIVIYDEGKINSEKLDNLIQEHKERCERLIASGEGLYVCLDQLTSREKLLSNLNRGRVTTLCSLSSQIPIFNVLKTISFDSSLVSRYSVNAEQLVKDVQAWRRNKYKVVLCCDGDAGAERIYFTLKEGGVRSFIDNDISLYGEGNVIVTTYDVPKGFISHDNKFVLLGVEDLLIKPKGSGKLKKKRGELFTAPEIGDIAVHETFGIGIVRGFKRLNFIEGEKDYIELEYAGGDRLYVCTDQMDKLTKYVGSSEAPSLNRLGSSQFERVKERARRAIAKMAINLKALYKERKEEKGFKFAEDDEFMLDFYNSFEYEETEDQAASWEEIKKDMESTKVMDRLLCGDVGFGKTEVAFRACFKAIMSGKQAAIICPTTILSEQHYNTAIKRFHGFGVRICVLNRFKTAKDQIPILKEISEGKYHLIIGTHRLLSKDVQFKDLGLLVIDEEQRFGVEQKEKIKVSANHVDTLTLSATPIPRTLHMSLSGIRDISTINTPPKGRIPVQVIVSEYTDEIIRELVEKELDRKGQVFILYNRVETIYSFSEHIREIIPSARIIVTHGQLPERELENNIHSFYQGEGDVLITTSIIENGIDLPTANTLIVIDSDKLGLSTLYQLKGRVGRGNLMAYACFTYANGKVLTEDAYKRLMALTDYTEMGSGFKVAMRDLEIRGAGNVLGAEQHGHMEDIGYELYSKLLKEELGEITKNQDIELDVKADAYIPENYIDDERNRIEAYKQIADISNDDEYLRVKEELFEAYGTPPKQVETLLDISKLKYLARNHDIIKILVSRLVAKMYLRGLNSLSDGVIVNKLNNSEGKASLMFEDNPIISFDNEKESPENKVKDMIEFLSK